MTSQNLTTYAVAVHYLFDRKSTTVYVGVEVADTVVLPCGDKQYRYLTEAAHQRLHKIVAPGWRSMGVISRENPDNLPDYPHFRL